MPKSWPLLELSDRTPTRRSVFPEITFVPEMADFSWMPSQPVSSTRLSLITMFRSEGSLVPVGPEALHPFAFQIVHKVVVQRYAFDPGTRILRRQTLTVLDVRSDAVGCQGRPHAVHFDVLDGDEPRRTPKA